MSILYILSGMLIGGGLNDLYYKYSNRCQHEWELHKEGEITDYGVAVGYYKAYQCEKCHKFKKVRY